MFSVIYSCKDLSCLSIFQVKTSCQEPFSDDSKLASGKRSPFPRAFSEIYLYYAYYMFICVYIYIYIYIHINIYIYIYTYHLFLFRGGPPAGAGGGGLRLHGGAEGSAARGGGETSVGSLSRGGNPWEGTLHLQGRTLSLPKHTACSIQHTAYTTRYTW